MPPLQRARALAALLLVLPVALAGCLGGAQEPASEPTQGASAGGAAPPVVIAVVDTGVNAYHEAFRGAPTFADVPAFPADARAVALTLDATEYEAALDADREAWAQVAEGELVWFPGTRLAGISFGTTIATPRIDGKPDEGEYAVLDASGHGSVTTHAALEAAPHAVAVMVQIPDDEQIADAMRWIAQQPWIDVVSVSMGTWLEEHAMGESDMGLPPAYAEAARAGKLIFNAAGNEPIPHLVGEHSGPPFIVAVGGAQNATHGDTRIAARFPDVVGAFIHLSRAEVGTLDGYVETGGTSLACPLVAGTAAEALWLARDGGAAPTADELRDALQRRAQLWGPTEWQPPADPSDPQFLTEVLLSNPVVLGPAQMGWGYTEPAHAADVAAHLLGEASLPEKPPEVVAFMDAREQLRRAAWGGGR